MVLPRGLPDPLDCSPFLDGGPRSNLGQPSLRRSDQHHNGLPDLSTGRWLGAVDLVESGTHLRS
jgi:hypothetical protein